MSIENFLDIEENEEETKELVVIEENNDADFVRTNYINLIKKASDLADEAIETASMLQSAAGYQAAGYVIKAALDANKNLQDLAETRAKLAASSQQTKNITNNNLFVGTREELFELIESRKNGGN